MGARGEGVIRVFEREVRVLFTNRALARAEIAMGRTVLELLREAGSDGFGMNDVAQLLQVGMEAAARDAGEKTVVTLDQAFEVMDEAGYIETMRVVIEGLSAVMQFGGERGDRPPV